MIIREANLNDLPQLLELEQYVIEYERSFNPSLKSSDTYYYDLPHLISNEDSNLLVADLSGKLIATSYAQIRDSKESLVHTKHSYLGFMFVSPDHRRKGINQKLLDHLIKWSQSKGVNDFYLHVYSKNDSAIKAYDKAGFESSLIEMKLSL